MKSIYYLDTEGNVQGPVSYDQLKILHRNSQISGATQICKEGSEEWFPYFKAAEKGFFVEPKKEGISDLQENANSGFKNPISPQSFKLRHLQFLKKFKLLKCRYPVLLLF